MYLYEKSGKKDGNCMDNVDLLYKIQEAEIEQGKSCSRFGVYDAATVEVINSG